MVSGHVVEAIALLRTARYADDALAQILLAQLLAFDHEHAEALAIFLRHVDGRSATPRRRCARPQRAHEPLRRCTIAGGGS
jgi:hypothetical protein